jgi:hypothetical protein
MIAEWTIGRLGMEKYVEPWVYQAVGIDGEGGEEEPMSIADRVLMHRPSIDTRRKP